MNDKKKDNGLTPRLLQIVTASALVVAPLVAATGVAQAKPPAHAPAHGYYKTKNDKKDKDKKYERRDDDRRDRDDDDNDDRGYGYNRDRYDSNRGTNRDRYDYNRDRYDYNRDNNRDRYDYNRDRDYNRDQDYNNRNKVRIGGRVTRDINGREFEVRLDDGRTVRVRANREPGRLTQGDRVMMYGVYASGQRNLFLAENVNITRNVGGNYVDRDDRNGSIVNFPGVVLSSSRNTLTVRGENNRVYTVRWNDADRLNRGDRVRVYGRVTSNNVVTAQNVRRY